MWGTRLPGMYSPLSLGWCPRCIEQYAGGLTIAARTLTVRRADIIQPKEKTDNG